MRPMTRRERRAERQRRFAEANEARLAPRLARLDDKASGESGTPGMTDRDAPLPGWLRPLDYKVSGESGALRVRSKVRTWHLGGRANGHAPPPGQAWDRSGPTYVTGIYHLRFANPVPHHRWRRQVADCAQPSPSCTKKREGRRWER